MNIYSRYLALTRALLTSGMVGWLINNWLGFVLAVTAGLYELHQAMIHDNPLKTDADRVLDSLDPKNFEKLYLKIFHACMSGLTMGIVIMVTIRCRCTTMLAATISLLTITIYAGLFRK